MASFTFLFSALFLVVLVVAKEENIIRAKVVTITSDNWKDMLSGEWMVEFYAPWCPYCTQFTPVWEDFAEWASDFEVKVGKVDITTESVLGGQFMIEQLPTIFHIKDGEVRLYSDERSPVALHDFIEKNNYVKVAPISWYKSPTSLHMYGLGVMFQWAQEAQKLEEYLRKEYDLSTWGIFGIMAAATVVIGLCIGLFCVVLSEVVSRVRSPQRGRRPVQVEKPTGSDNEDNEGRNKEEEEEETNTGPKGNDKARKRNRPKRETD